MALWLLAAVVGLAAAALGYGARALNLRVAPLAALRALAVAIVVALLLGAPGGRSTPLVPEVALDASESWLRAAPGCGVWQTALDSASRIGGTRLRFGDSLRVDRSAAPPTDHASRLRTVADRAAGSGYPVIVITDGELEDADALSSLPRGSRAIVMRCPPGRDLALSSIDAPRSILAGDTITTRLTVVAGGAGSTAGQVELRLDDQLVATQPVSALGAFAEQTVVLRGVATGAPERPAVLRAQFRGAGDAEPRNDTLSLGVDVSRAAAAVFVSTAPDFDAREAVAALRGVTSLPTRAYYRVAVGAWRTDGTLARVGEDEVKTAVRDAPIVILHGDTTLFGPPRSATRGALLLFAPPTTDEGEWLAAAAPASPLAAALSALPFDSLPPLSVAPSLPRGEWQGLIAREPGAGGERRVVITGWETPRHIAVLGASGFWRWRFRGGQRSDAYGTLFGTLFDWLAAGRSDKRAVVPDAGVFRAGAPVRWRRGASTDSIVAISITRRGTPARTDSMTLRFRNNATLVESPPLQQGVYDVRSAGGTSVIAVNASAELLPRRATVTNGRIGGSPSLADAPLARDLGWLYAVVVLALCAEWLLRRRAGLR